MEEEFKSPEVGFESENFRNPKKYFEFSIKNSFLFSKAYRMASRLIFAIGVFMKKILLYSMSAFYIFAGINHFVNPGFYLKMMPPYLPAHSILNWISGGAEILFALGLWFRPTRTWACYGIILLLIAVLPANVYMLQAALAGEPFGLPIWGLYVRLPFQLVFIAWAWFVRDVE